MTTPNLIFAHNLERQIRERSITQRELAKAIGVSAPTVHDWVKGNIYPRIDKIEKLAQYFGCDKSDLIEDRKPSHTRISPQEVGDIIRRRREELRLTLADLADRVGLTAEELANWESGQTADKNINVAKKLSIILRLPFGTIIGIQPTPETAKKKNFFRRLEEAFINIIFTDAEIEQLIAYGKFLVSQRKE